MVISLTLVDYAELSPLTVFRSPLWYPLQTSVNYMLGIFGCYILFMSAYYGNLWRSKDFPFLSQFLFNGTVSNQTNYVTYNQSLILNDKFEIDHAALAREGIPYITGSYIMYLITSNMGLTAALVHMLLWNYDDIKYSWAFAKPSNLKKIFHADFWMFWKNQETPEQRLQRKQNDPDLDPHYKLMLRNKYRECPQWWWLAVAGVSWIVGLACLYIMRVSIHPISCSNKFLLRLMD